MPGKPGSLPVQARPGQAYTPRPGLYGLLRPLVLLFDDAYTIVRTDVIVLEANITTSNPIGIWQAAIDILREIALLRAVVHRFMRCVGRPGRVIRLIFLIFESGANLWYYVIRGFENRPPTVLVVCIIFLFIWSSSSCSSPNQPNDPSSSKSSYLCPTGWRRPRCRFHPPAFQSFPNFLPYALVLSIS